MMFSAKNIFLIVQKIHSVILFFVFTCFYASAQDISHYKIDDNVGLPSNEVYQTLQDDFGFIWIGCDAGLFRYDGFNFKAYSCSNQNSRSVSNLKKDLDGNIWCQNFTGQIFKVKGEELQLFYDGSGMNSQYPPFTIDKENRIWIATDKSILLFSTNKKLLKTVSNQAFGSANDGWQAIEAFKEDVIAISKTGAFFKINRSSLSIKPLALPKDIGSRHIINSTQNALFIFSERNPTREYYVSQLDGNQIKLKEIIEPVAGAGIHYFFKSTLKYNFMGTSDGLIIAPNNLTFNQSNASYLKNIKVSDVFEDKESNLWVSTLQDGIILIPNLSIKIYNASNSVLTDQNIYCLSKNGDNLLFGTYSGEIYQLANSKLNLIQSNNQASYRAIRKIIQYKGSTIIACGPLLATNFPQINRLSSLNNIRDMVIMNDTLYFITPDRAGAISLTSKDKKIKIIRPTGGKKIICDPKTNTVYMACQDGLFSYSQGKVDEIKVANNSVFTSDFAISNSTLWIGTMTNGLLQLSLSTKKIDKKLNTIKGKNIKCLYIKNDQLWVATEIGLNHYSLSSKRLTILNKQDGIDFLEINDMELVNGVLYLATIKGLVEFPTMIKSYNPVSPKIQLISARVGKTLISSPKKIEISYNEGGISIQFIATAFRSRGDFKYQYRILNHDANWKKQNSASPYIAIASLPPGNYVFEVRAVNEDGIGSKDTAQLNIVVHPPYYEKWWFYLLIALVGALIVTIGFSLRIKYLKKKSAANNQLIISQLTALKAQMNPHFMYNTLSSIQDFIWKNDTKNSNYYLSRFSLLMRKILDASDSNKISLSEEIEILSLYLELEQLRFGDSFTYTLTMDNNVDSDHIYIPAMIIQPFVENAIKHGLLHKNGSKKLKIHFSLQKSTQSKMEVEALHCRVEDNGVGRKKAGEIKTRQEAQHRSFATKATQKRIELLNLYDDSEYKFTITDLYHNEKAVGTLVELVLPFVNS